LFGLGLDSIGLPLIQGRLDVHLDFKHASKWQAEGIFKNFYPTKAKFKDEATLADLPPNVASGALSAPATTPPPSENAKPKNPAAPIIPLLEEDELTELAKQFAAQIPEDEMSVRIHSSSILSFVRARILRVVRLCLCLLTLCGLCLSVWSGACDIYSLSSTRLLDVIVWA
jgi:hypothetical protein